MEKDPVCLAENICNLMNDQPVKWLAADDLRLYQNGSNLPADDGFEQKDPFFFRLEFVHPDQKEKLKSESEILCKQSAGMEESQSNDIQPYLLDHLKDRNHNLISELCYRKLLIMLSQIGIDVSRMQIRFTKAGKGILWDPLNHQEVFWFSISHDQKTGVVLISERICGVDFERKIPAVSSLKRLWPPLSNSDCENPIQRQIIWTEMEAAAKCLGISLLDLKKQNEIPVSFLYRHMMDGSLSLAFMDSNRK